MSANKHSSFGKGDTGSGYEEGSNHQLPDVLFDDIAERDANTVYSSNPENLFNGVWIESTQELQMLVSNTALPVGDRWISGMAAATPGIDSVLAVEQLIATNTREITAIDDVFFNIKAYDQAVNAFLTGTFLDTRGTDIALGNITGDGAGNITGTSELRLSDSGMVFSDDINSKGPENAADYSANFVDNSLVTKIWVEDNFTAGPVSSVDNRIATFDGITGEVIKDNSLFTAIGDTIASSGDIFIEALGGGSFMQLDAADSLILRAGTSANLQGGGPVSVKAVNADVTIQTVTSGNINLAPADGEVVLLQPDLTTDSLIVFKDSGGGTDATFGLAQDGTLDPDFILLSLNNLGITSTGNTDLTAQDTTIQSTVAANPAVRFQNSANDTGGIYVSAGDPTGSITPAAGGYLAQDITNFELYKSTGTGINDWEAFLTASSNFGSTNQEIIFNNSGVLAGKDNFVFDHANEILRLGNATDPMKLVILRGGAIPTGAGLPANTAAIHTQGDGTVQADIGVDCVADTAFGAPEFFMRRARATGDIVADGDVLGVLEWKGHDGIQYEDAGAIRMRVDGTPAAGDMPGRIEFLTTPPGSTVDIERMRLDSAGDLGLGTPSPDARLHVMTADASVTPLTNRQFITEGTGGGGGMAIMGEETTELSYVFGFPSNNALGGIYYFPGNGMQLRANGTTRMTVLEGGNIGINQGTPVSRLDLGGSLGLPRIFSAGNLNSNDEVVLAITDTTAPRTITILTVDIIDNRVFWVQDESGAASVINPISVTPQTGTINGEASIDITVPYGGFWVRAFGGNLFAIG